MAMKRECGLTMAAMARVCAILGLLVLAVVFVAADPAGDKAVLQAFLAGITNGDTLGWTDPDPCNWSTHSVKCDAAGNVQQLRVRALGLTGTVTPTLNQLSQLTYLELNFNSFTGAMPSLKGMSMLQTAFLDDNEFDTIPGDFFDGLTSIQELHVENNPKLNATSGGWSLPASLELPSLTTLAITNASVTGPLPSFLGTLPALRTLEASYNSLQGGIPESFASSGIQVLKLNNQQMNGTLAPLGGMGGLVTLWVQVNNFFGPIPTGLTGASGLQSLRINDNRLVGRVPLGLATIPALSEVLMQNNKLTGELPTFATSVVTNSDATTYCAAAGVACTVTVNSLLDFLAAAGWPQAVAVTWIGSDPCTGWTGVSCASGKVVSIVLIGASLTGTISPSLGNLTSLSSLVLSKNALTGPVPDSLTKLASLKTVDVSNNNLTGPLPLFPASVKFTYTGNPLLMPGAPGPSPTNPSPPGTVPSPPVLTPPGSPNVPGAPNTPSPTSDDSSSKSSKSAIGPIVGGVLGGVAIAFLAFFLVFCYCKRKKKQLQGANGMSIHPRGDSGSDSELMKVMVEHSYSGASHQATAGSYDSLHSGTSSNDQHQVIEQQGQMVMSINMLRMATNNFSEQNIIGRGGFGVVYRGELEDGTQIAVKRMEAAVVSNKGLSEFQSEITVLTKVKHRHLVGLLGYCADGNERLLVYEYMPQGTLSQHLFEYRELQEKPLTWMMRLTIALDVARGLDYLHNLAHRSFIHRDLKPSNILLTDDFRAKVSDFGLVKLAPEGKYSVETRLAGTFGYLAPEYAVTGRVTTKADVFSFGVVLMELLIGRRALDETQTEENMHLVTWFQRMMVKNKNDFRSAVDPTMIVDDETYKTMTIVAELAGHCTSREPYQRPDMSHCVNVLAPLVEQWKPSASRGDQEACGSGDGDVELSLPQALKQWQEFEFEGDLTYTQRLDDSKCSLPVRPHGFADSFTSTDGR